MKRIVNASEMRPHVLGRELHRELGLVQVAHEGSGKRLNVVKGGGIARLPSVGFAGFVVPQEKRVCRHDSYVCGRPDTVFSECFERRHRFRHGPAINGKQPSAELINIRWNAPKDGVHGFGSPQRDFDLAFARFRPHFSSGGKGLAKGSFAKVREHFIHLDLHVTFDHPEESRSFGVGDHRASEVILIQSVVGVTVKTPEFLAGYEMVHAGSS